MYFGFERKSSIPDLSWKFSINLETLQGENQVEKTIGINRPKQANIKFWIN